VGHDTSEVWESVPGFGGKYEASSLGRIRVAATGLVKKQRVYRGYPMTSVYDKGRGTRRVHQLVAAAFHGPCPEGMEVRHLDGVRTNNTPSMKRGCPLASASEAPLSVMASSSRSPRLRATRIPCTREG
jgi:hypothetical protein